jgi:Na+/melibiose symporter-like transporter
LIDPGEAAFEKGCGFSGALFVGGNALALGGVVAGAVLAAIGFTGVTEERHRTVFGMGILRGQQ